MKGCCNKYEQLKAKLQAEGLFNQQYEKTTSLPCALRWCDRLEKPVLRYMIFCMC
ncbi:hypothetical protein ACLK19_16600 [Escherichia coli]